jgi:SEC-C motif-containing protein
MRSRYSAFVVGDAAYLRETWHGSTRPDSIELDPGIRWTGLEIVEVVNEGDRAVVEFRAHFRDAEGAGIQQERSRFSKRAGRWFYVDAAE